jgi:hypothetical protein
MVCDLTIQRPNQTLSERKDEVKRAVEAISRQLAAGSIKVRVGPQGAVAFEGLTEADRKGISDNCVYRQIMVRGSALAKQKISVAEALAGRTVDKKMIAQGWHRHGDVWHPGHKKK